MKKWIAVMLVCVFALAFCGCGKSDKADVMDQLRASPMAKLVLPDGRETLIDTIYISSFPDLLIVETPLEPDDSPEDWLYRIVYNPSEVVQNAEEIVVSFHETYVQVGDAYYVGAEGVNFAHVLEWAKGKFAYYME